MQKTIYCEKLVLLRMGSENDIDQYLNGKTTNITKTKKNLLFTICCVNF